MAQDWCYNHPLVDGHGNFGSVEGDDAAASRYTEARLSAITEDILLSDLDKDVVDFVPNFDNKEKEPTVLPACVPNILISGTDGIAVGMASKMPTHNLGEVIDATVALIEKPKMKEEQVLEYIKGPDFATGGIIVNKSELPEIYKNGAGRIRVRARVKTENGDRGKINIVVTEIPFTMIGCIDKFMDTVADLVRAKAMPDVMDIKNFSGKEGVRIVIELRKGADVEQNINLLYKKAKLEDTFGYNAVLLSGGVPYQMSLLRILTEFVDFYRETMTRKYKNLLAREKKSAEVKEGLITAVDCIDTIIEVFRGSSVVPVAKKCLMKGITDGIKFKTKRCEKIAKSFCFTEIQADAILDMKLQKLIGLEMTTLIKELDKCKKNIELYGGLLSSKTKMNNKMKSDLLEIKKKYAVKRKTEIVDADAIVLKKPEIKEEKVYALVNRFGYIKLVDEGTFERNKENVSKDCRYVCEVMNTGKLYVFTRGGKCHQIKAMSVPMGRYNDKGVPLEQLSGLTMGEEVICVISDYKPKEKLLFVTDSGLVKRVLLSEFDTSRRSTDSTKLADGDSVIFVGVIKEKQSVVLVSEKRMCVIFDCASAKLLKKNSVGVIGMKLDKNDRVEYAAVTGEDGTFTFEEKQYNANAVDAGKRATRGKRLT
jgi:DNA gyrase subunit A